MSSNFDFLRNFDNDLHYLACIIEDEIYDSPSAVLTDATTFLEIIIYDIFKKNELQSDGLVYFKDKIQFLSAAGFLSTDLRKQMVKAYSIRNKMHSYNGDAKNHIHLNQLRAVNLHKLLFNVAWLYYSENAPNQFKVSKPSYIHPSRLKNDVLVQSELGNGKCIICEGKTASEDELFCRDCKYKIEKSDNLKTLRKHFGFKKGFKRNDLIEMGFEKGYIGSFIQELKKDDLINSVGKLYFIDQENTNKYIEEAEAMMGVEKLLSDFKLRNISLNDIFNNELFQMGKEKKYPYVGLYHMFSEILYNSFITQINKGTSIEEILNQSYLTLEELDEWYFKNQTPEHELFNERIVDEIFQYKRKKLEYDFKITSEILAAIEESEYYHQKEDELLFSRFLQRTISEKVTKKEALGSVGLTENDLNEFLDKYPDFRARFEKSYTERKMEKFLKHYDFYNYDYSLKKNGLTQDEINDWLDRGRKNESEIYVDFLNAYKEMTFEKYVHYRKEGKTQQKALKIVKSDADTISQLLDEFDNDLDEHFVKKAIELLKSQKSKEAILKILDLDLEWFNSAIEKGMKGEEPYVGLYEEYSRTAIPNLMAEFMELIKTKPLNNVLKELNIDKNELNGWYTQGKNSIAPYDKFYEEFLEYKKETYIKAMIKTGAKQKSLKKSYLTNKEFNEFEDELTQRIANQSMDIVIGELQKGSTTKKAAKKASLKISVIYDWIRMALDGNDEYADFLEVYKREYLIPIRKAYAEGVKQGVDEKQIIRTMRRNEFLVNDDVKQLKQLGLFPKPEDEIIELDEELEINK